MKTFCSFYLVPDSLQIVQSPVTETEDSISPGSFKIPQSGEMVDQNDETVEVPVKRLLSRHRRFIAPGTRWDWLAGWETVSENFEITFYLLVRVGQIKITNTNIVLF